MIRRCEWCNAEIPVDARRDTRYCPRNKNKCRQAAHRFLRAVARGSSPAPCDGSSRDGSPEYSGDGSVEVLDDGSRPDPRDGSPSSRGDTSRPPGEDPSSPPRGEPSPAAGADPSRGPDPSRADPARPMRFAYADPPYPGKAHLYKERREVDHAALISRLEREYPDGWALSTSAAALQAVLRLCPPGVRVCVWRRQARHVPSSRAINAWEPVIVAGGRELSTAVVQDLEDVLDYRGRYFGYPGALVGMKPPEFSVWLFRQLGARAGDELADLFPGSGAVARAWHAYTSRAPAGDPSRDTNTAA